jgi:hypothetical protein
MKLSHSFVIAQFCHRTVLSSQSLSSQSFVITKFCHPDEGRNTQETPQRNSATLCRATCVIIFVEFLLWSLVPRDDKLKDKLQEGLL